MTWAENSQKVWSCSNSCNAECAADNAECSFVVDVTSQTTCRLAARDNSGHHSQTKSSKTSTKGGDETTRDATTTTQRVGALKAHHPAWMGHHTGGFRQGPLSLRGKAVGGPLHFSTCHSCTSLEHAARVRRGIRKSPEQRLRSNLTHNSPRNEQHVISTAKVEQFSKQREPRLTRNTQRMSPFLLTTTGR